MRLNPARSSRRRSRSTLAGSSSTIRMRAFLKTRELMSIRERPLTAATAIRVGDQLSAAGESGQTSAGAAVYAACASAPWKNAVSDA